jgi:hypothetical protein
MIGESIFAACHQAFAQAGAVAAGVIAVKAVSISRPVFGRGADLVQERVGSDRAWSSGGHLLRGCAFYWGASLRSALPKRG